MIEGVTTSHPFTKQVRKLKLHCIELPKRIPDVHAEQEIGPGLAPDGVAEIISGKKKTSRK